MIVKLLTEHHLEFLSFTGGCTGSSESTLVKIPHCWKSRVTAQIFSVHFPEDVQSTFIHHNSLDSGSDHNQKVTSGNLPPRGPIKTAFNSPI